MRLTGSGKADGAKHKKNATPSNKSKHESGQARKSQDRNGSKGMSKPPRRKPEGWKGSWPPKS